VRLDVVPVAAVASPPLAGEEGVVVIDVLRATSTAVTALANGCTGIVPVASPAEARREAWRLGSHQPLLAGERGGRKIKGFDLSNSPLEFLPEVVKGKVIVFCTTNGTRALLRARRAGRVVLAAMLNLSAVVRRMCREERDWLVFCAGNEGGVSLEDLACAGLLVRRLLEAGVRAQLGDGARAALAALGSGDSLPLGSHGEFLRRLGLGADVEFCLQRDLYPIVPVYRGGWVVKGD
jgi:2-phosphosulfolactate phosphatase